MNCLRFCVGKKKSFALFQTVLLLINEKVCSKGHKAKIAQIPEKQYLDLFHMN